MARFFVLNNKAIRVERISAYSWELFIEDERHGCHPTLRKAREHAEGRTAVITEAQEKS